MVPSSIHLWIEEEKRERERGMAAFYSIHMHTEKYYGCPISYSFYA